MTSGSYKVEVFRDNYGVGHQAQILDAKGEPVCWLEHEEGVEELAYLFASAPQLRQQRDEFYQLLVRLKSWANDVPPEETPWDNSEEESLMEEVKRALASTGKEE